MGRARRGGGLRGCSILVDNGDCFADADRIALGAHDPRQDAGLVGRHVDVYFVRLELDQRLAGRDALSLGFKPLADRSVDDRLAERRDADFNRHAVLPSS